MRSNGQKGQGATEYLVLLAIVLVICLVSISLLNFFPGISFETRMSESQVYWKAVKPFQILDYTQSAGSDVLWLVVSNAQTDQLTLTEVTAVGNGAIGSNNSSIYISGGEAKAVMVLFNDNTCIDGGKYEYDLDMTYHNWDGSVQNKEFGEKKLVGKCASGGDGEGWVAPVEGGDGNETQPTICGLQGMQCCPPAGTCTSGLICRVGGCESCGGFGQTCCNNDACDGGNICLFSTCV